VFSDAIRARLDNRGELSGDQFRYQVTKEGKPYQGRFALMEDEAFQALLEEQEQVLQSLGRRIFQGDASVDPWKAGRAVACDQCDYPSVCRIDPWTHAYRVLRADAVADAEGEAGGEA
jgi:ATP-dependent helicase/nuclease subunit B